MLFQNILPFIFHSSSIQMNLQMIHFIWHFNSAADMFNFDIKDVETTKAKVRKLLKVKLYLRIICEELISIFLYLLAFPYNFYLFNIFLIFSIIFLKKLFSSILTKAVLPFTISLCVLLLFLNIFL